MYIHTYLETNGEYCESEIVSKVSVVLRQEHEDIIHHERGEVYQPQKMGPYVNSLIRPYECTVCVSVCVCVSVRVCVSIIIYLLAQSSGDRWTL